MSYIYIYIYLLSFVTNVIIFIVIFERRRILIYPPKTIARVRSISELFGTRIHQRPGDRVVRSKLTTRIGVSDLCVGYSKEAKKDSRGVS